jgi:ubiquinone/menaquinone biosynthesis C-methylase UbiE
LSVNPTGRFSVRAPYYSKYRPGYPDQIVGVLQKEFRFNRSNVVADIGSGTGLLAKVFLANGNRVFGVEPNARMRSYGVRNLAGFKKFVSVRGTAEHTTLDDESVDLVTVGQALHWFNASGTIREFSRISKPECVLCIVYNERRKGSRFMRAFQQVTERHEGDKTNSPDVDDRYAAQFFEGRKFSKFHLPNEQTLDYVGLVGRLLSASYMPTRGQRTKFARMERDVKELFDSFQSDGRVRLLYDTRVYAGMIPRRLG